MAQYKEKLATVEAVQFVPPKEVKHDSRFVLSKDESLPVGQDNKGVHSILAGRRIEPGDWVVTYIGGGPRKTFTDVGFKLRYEPISTK